MATRNNRGLKNAKAQAKAGILAAEDQVRAIREVASQLVEASTKVAATGTDVLGGVLGSSVLTALGIAFSSALALPLVAIPFIAVVGMSAGVFAARGLLGIRGDRRRRELDLDRQAQVQATEDYFGLLENGLKRGLLDKAQAQEQAGAFMKVRLLPRPLRESIIEAKVLPTLEADPKLLPPAPEPEG